MKVKLIISELALIEAKAHGILNQLKEDLILELEPVIQHYNDIDVAVQTVDVVKENGEMVQFYHFKNPLTGNIEIYSKEKPIDSQIKHSLLKEF